MAIPLGGVAISFSISSRVGLAHGQAAVDCGLVACRAGPWAGRLPATYWILSFVNNESRHPMS